MSSVKFKVSDILIHKDTKREHQVISVYRSGFENMIRTQELPLGAGLGWVDRSETECFVWFRLKGVEVATVEFETGPVAITKIDPPIVGCHCCVVGCWKHADFLFEQWIPVTEKHEKHYYCKTHADNLLRIEMQ